MLSEISQLQRQILCDSHLHEVNAQCSLIQGDRKYTSSYRGQEAGMWDHRFMGTEFQFYKIESVKEMDGHNGCTTL